ncbi:PKD domain-containing protein [Chitinophaga horti]|uniref:PKD domain-containing protein n=1 Tax=Chitinophaga horti TaxID=2920382 RepID=A0ABY6J5X7_9BACT|nr:PKD domain-containing protein [Chitinophaga horti]UYQ93579.1 PKD domain-containing protein [Chitinophaga horti]
MENQQPQTLRNRYIHRVLLLAMIVLCAHRTVGQTVDFTADKFSGCVPLTVSFSNLSDPGAVSYNWNFGLGAAVPEKDPAKIFTVAGTYNVVLTVTYPGNIVKTATKTITVYEAPTAVFTTSPLSGCTPLTVSFTDQSTPGSGTIARVLWDFGDGVTSETANPAHTYTLPGNYTVGSIVTNSFGCTSGYTLPTPVKVQSTPVADFTASPTSGCTTPMTVNFTSSAPAGVTYNWDFGDAAAGSANNSSLANPSHTYTSEGSYTVTLTATTSEGCAAVVTKSNLVVIRSTVADFTFSNSCVGSAVQFTNTTTPAPTVATWFFPDGSSQTGINASKVFTAPGNYQVTLVSGTPGCTQTTIKTITIAAKPAVDFSATPITGCNVPFTTQFNALAPGSTQYRWTFGDNTTSTTANPEHTYNAEGDYTVKLWAANAQGCADSITKPAYIRVRRPTIVLSAAPPEGCIPFNTTLSANITNGGAVTGYQWDFGDGATSTAATPAHTYTTEGSFNVKVVITFAGGCKDSSSIPVRAGNIPVVQFDADPKITCAATPVQFTNQSTPRGTSWSWLFPEDNGVSSQENPLYTFRNEGLHDVTLIVNNYGCIRSLTKTDFITIQPPIASFTRATSCTDKFLVQFTDNSDFGDAPTTRNWSWDFGDRQTSTEQSPAHRYAAAGFYRVTLTVSNGTCQHTFTGSVRVIDEQPVISANATTICAGGTITFTRSNINDSNIASFSWNWNDNTSTQTRNLTWNKRYSTPGVYNVVLTVLDSNNCRTASTPLTITVNGPKADFTYTGRNCKGDEQRFSDNSAANNGNALTQWVFDYGDGSKPDTFTTKPVSIAHAFANAGNYNVRLTVTDASGCSTTIAKAVSVIGVKAVIGRNASVVCLNSSMGFNSTSSQGGPLTYLWSFGDGTTSTEAHPGKRYDTAGLFDVSLTVTNAIGCTDTQSEADYILVPNPKAAFTLPANLANCPPVLVQLTNESTGSNRVIWDFGDGSRSVIANASHVYTLPDTYTIKLFAYAEGNCVDSTSQQVEIKGPRGTRTITDKTGCAPQTVSFSATSANAVKYIWDYDDGTVQTTTTPASSHSYTREGLYFPRVVLEDAQGCQVIAQGPADTVLIEQVKASFTATPSVICDAGEMRVADMSAGLTKDLLGQAFRYQWDFGVPGRTNDVATTPNAVFRYEQFGTYEVKLKVTSAIGCVDSATTSIRVDEKPNGNIASRTAICPGDTITFNGSDAKNLPNTEWNWQYSGKNYPNLRSLSLNFPEAGLFEIKLIIKNQEGTCSDTSVMNLRVNPKPALAATPKNVTVCRGQSIQLNANVPESQVTWTNYRISNVNSQTPIVDPVTDTLYHVVAVNQFGCFSEDNVRIAVTQPHEIRTGDATICEGNVTQLAVTGNATRYQWLPSPTINRTDVLTPLVNPTVTTRYAVVGYGEDACFTDTAWATVTVNPKPKLVTGGDRTVPAGSVVPLNIQSSPDVITWKWSPAKYLDCYDCPQPTATPRENITYNVLATNVYGCTSTEEIAIRLQCLNSVTFLPNSFSPNGDGQNDVFYVRGRGVKSVRTFRIFNRWGELVFERANFNIDDIAFGWDGRHAGQLLVPDVYVYYVQAVCDNNEPLLLKGNVTLLR